jgi:hypothetical protein
MIVEKITQYSIDGFMRIQIDGTMGLSSDEC